MKTHRLSIYFLFTLLLITSITVFARLIEIESTQQYEQLAQEKNPTLIKFAADWCGVCQNVKEPFKHIAQEKEFDAVTFAQVNVDTMTDLSKKHHVAGIPTFVYIDDGKQVHQEVGVQNVATFQGDLRSNLRKTFNLAQNKATEMEIEKIKSKPGQIEQDEKSSFAKATADRPQKKQPAPGILGAIKDFFTKIIELIREAIKYVIDKIIGIFR